MLEADLHIDLHSFPPVDVPTKTSTGYSLDVWSRYDVVLFNTPEITDQDFLRSIESELEEMSIEAAEEQGGFENYLSNMANVLFDLPSVLVEVNEGRPELIPRWHLPWRWES